MIRSMFFSLQATHNSEAPSANFYNSISSKSIR